MNHSFNESDFETPFFGSENETLLSYLLNLTNTNSSSNTNSSTKCRLSDTFYHNAAILALIVYRIMPPFHIILGVAGHVLSLLAFYKQSKKEKAYAYQIFWTVSDLIYLLSVDALIYGLIDWPSEPWYNRSYAAIWYSGHVIMPVMQTAATMTLMASLVMALDRTYALTKPMSYQSADHHRHQLVAFTFCIVISVATNVFEYWRYVISPMNAQDGSYSLIFDVQFLSSTFAQVSSQTRNVIRSLGLLALIVCNIVMIVVYRRQTKKHLLVTTTATKDPHKEKEKKTREKSLLILVATQSACTFISVCAEMSFLYLLYTVPGWFIDCGYQDLAAAWLDGIIQVANVVQFYTAVFIDKPFRRTLLGIFPPCCQKKKNRAKVGVSVIDLPPNPQ